MDALLAKLHSDTLSLWYAVTTIENREAVALLVNAHDEGAASDFLASLQHLRSGLEQWASSGGIVAGLAEQGPPPPPPGTASESSIAVAESSSSSASPTTTSLTPGSDSTITTAAVSIASPATTIYAMANRPRSSSVLPDALPPDDEAPTAATATASSSSSSSNSNSTNTFQKGRQKRRQPQQDTATTSFVVVDTEDVQRGRITRELSAQPAGCLVPSFSPARPPKPNILRLAAAMRSPRAIDQVCHVRQFLRDGPRAELHAALINRRLTGQVFQEALDKGITICKRANHFANLLQRVSTWHFAEALELSKGPVALRVSSDVVSQFTTDGTKSRYNKTKYRGDLLHMVCGSHRGLVAFIPLHKDAACGINDPEAQYQYQATKRDFDTFQAIYDVDDAVTTVLCAIGTNFLDSCCYQDRHDFRYSDWLARLQVDFSPACFQAMADQLGGRCGCQ